MKRIVFLSVTFLFFLSCTNKTKTAMTDEQKATITIEVEKQYSDVISNLSKLDIEIWSEPWSKSEFISVNSGAYFPTFNEFRDSVKHWFTFRDSQKVEIIDSKVKVLTPDLVLLTGILSWNIHFKSGAQVKNNSFNTMLWKKEANDWKAIYLHESLKEN